jgi:CDP-glycerol glycerophosphotransferase (TagB/SpsB family)
VPPTGRALRIALIRAVHGAARVLPLRDRVVLAAPRTQRLTGNLAAIRAEISRRPRRPAVVVLTGPVPSRWRAARAVRQLAFDLRAAVYLATSRLVVLDDYLFALYEVRRRPGTTVVQAWHASGAFKRMGRSLQGRSFGGGEALLERGTIHSNYDIVLVSSQSVAPHYAEAFGQPADGFVSDIGIPRTDVLFGDAAIAAAAEVRRRYRLPDDRTILVHAPTFRGDSALDARAPDLLDTGELQRVLGDDHLLLVRAHPFVHDRMDLDRSRAGFVVDVSDHPEMNELLLVADVLITDYSSTMYEFALLGRPIAFLAPDLASYERERGFYFDYRTGVPGPVFETTVELAAYLRNGRFDRDRERSAAAGQAAFDVADGHASERFVDRFVLPLLGSGVAPGSAGAKSARVDG